MMESLKSSVVARMSRCGLTVERGCLIFSVINIIVVLTCLAISIYLVKSTGDHKDSGILTSMLFGLLYLVSIGLTLFTLLALVFAVLFCLGAYKKRTSLLMAYFVYGIIERILMTLLALGILSSNYDSNEDLSRPIAALIINIIYGLPLILVYRTYERLSTETTDSYKLMNNVPLA